MDGSAAGMLLKILKMATGCSYEILFAIQVCFLHEVIKSGHADLADDEYTLVLVAQRG